MATPSSRPSTQPADLDRLYAAHIAATRYFQTQLPLHDSPRAYLRTRGLDTAVDRDGPWRIGYAPRAWTALGDHLRASGFTDAELLRGGLAFRGRQGRVLDLFRDRIMFPLRNGDGRIVGFTGRIVQPPPPDQAPPKYLNSPDTPIYRKGEVLFGIAEQHDRIARGWPPVIVEGPTDTLAIWTAYPATGRTGLVAVATCGTALTAAQVDTIVELPGARRFGVGVGFDGDDAGRKAADRAYALLTEHHPATMARGARFAEGADPGALVVTAEGRSRLRATLERGAEPLLHVVIDHRIEDVLRRSPQLFYEVPGQMALARILAPMIAEQPPHAAAAAIGHIIDVTVAMTGSGIQAQRAANQTVHCITAAVATYLETTPVPAPAARSAPGPPTRPHHPAALAFPTPPTAAASAPIATTPTSARTLPAVAVSTRRAR
jgi:DNA primase catalytic core